MKLPKKSVFLPVHRKVHIQSIYTHNDSIVCNVCMVTYMYVDIYRERENIYIHFVVFPIKCQSFWDNQTYPIRAASLAKLAKQNIHPQLSANPKPSLMSHPGDLVISTESPSGKVKKISKASSSWKLHLRCSW